MASVQTPEQEAAAMKILRDNALASKEAAAVAAAALLAADPTNEFHNLPSDPVAAPPPPSFTQASLETMLAKAIESTTSGLKDSIVAVTRENTAIKAAQIRLEAQRLRVSDIGKTEGKTVSLAKQLEFTEDTIAMLEDTKALALGIIMDNPAAPVPAGPASPSKLVCKLADSKDGSLLLEQLDTLIATVKAKLKELTIIWGAPSYRVAFEAIGANSHLQGAVAEEAMKEISEAVARVENQAKAKRKEEATWGNAAHSNKQAKSNGGWGPSPSQDSRDWNGNQAQSDWQNQAPARPQGKGGQGKGGQGKGNHGKGKPYPPPGNPPASFGGNAAPVQRVGRPGPNQCAYCWLEGHYKDTCPELLANNAKWAAQGWS